MVLKTRRDYLEEIMPGDLFLIFMGMQKDPGSLEFITAGLVDRVTESRTVQNDATQRTLSISGRDFGKIFVDASTVADPVFAQVDNAYFTTALFQLVHDKKIVVSSSEALLHCLDIFYNQRALAGTIAKSQFNFPGRPDLSLVSLLDLTRYVQTPMYGYAISVAALLQNGNMWGLLESISNRAFCELFIDVRRNNKAEAGLMEHLETRASKYVSDQNVVTQRETKTAIAKNFATPLSTIVGKDVLKEEQDYSIALIHRQLPYDIEAFEALPTYTIYEAEVMQSSIGKATHDVFNFFRVRCPEVVQPAAMEAYGNILINESSIKAHGLKRLESETRYFYESKEVADAAQLGRIPLYDFSHAYKFYTWLMATWYAYNEQLLTGQFTVRFRPDIRCGSRLHLIRDSMIGSGEEHLYFYI
jgi:hypothetical protein